MIKQLVIFLTVGFVALNSYAMKMSDLFNALKKQPLTKIDKLISKEAEIAKKKTLAGFYPKIYGLANYEHFNSPTNLAPVTPTESAEITKVGGALPFSRNIKQIGVQADMPIFVWSLFNLTKKAELLHKSAWEKARLNLLKNQALLVSLNARLGYLENLHRAMLSRKKSLEATLSRVNIGVKNGRLPEIEKIKIESSINQIDIALMRIETDKKRILSSIEDLTSVKLNHSIEMRQTKKIKQANFYSIKPLEDIIASKKEGLKAQEHRLYPSLYAKASSFRRFGKAYNNNEDVVKNYSSVAIFLQIPIFDKTIYSDIESARVDYLKKRLQLEQLETELKATSDELNNDINIIDNSIRIAEKEVRYQQQLLKYAKVAFQTQRMTEEEYLRYEDSLLNASAGLFDLRAKRWEILSELAVIYGNDLEEIVK